VAWAWLHRHGLERPARPETAGHLFWRQARRGELGNAGQEREQAMALMRTVNRDEVGVLLLGHLGAAVIQTFLDGTVFLAVTEEDVLCISKEGCHLDQRTSSTSLNTDNCAISWIAE
jgi:hypothetical protein